MASEVGYLLILSAFLTRGRREVETLSGREKSVAHDLGGLRHRSWTDIDNSHANACHFRLFSYQLALATVVVIRSS